MSGTAVVVGLLVVLAVLGAFAEFERDLIKQRTKAGVKAAQERGVRFGQPSKKSISKKYLIMWL